MTISIVTCVYNGSCFIEHYIDAVSHILDLVDDIIIVNDGSSDDSLFKLEQFSKQIEKIKVYSKENTGLAASRNFGINLVDSEFVIFLDIDDVIPRDSLLYGINLVSISNPDFLYGNVEYFSRSKSRNKNRLLSYVKSKTTPPVTLIKEKIFYNNFLVTPGNCIFRTSVVLENLFDPKITLGEDWDFFTRVIPNYKGIYADKYKIFYFVHTESMSSTLSRDKRKLDLLREKLVSNFSPTNVMSREVYSNYLKLNFEYFILKKELHNIKLFNLIARLNKIFLTYNGSLGFKVKNTLKLILMKLI